MTTVEAGKKGGLKVLKKYGRKHFKLMIKTRWEKYYELKRHNKGK